MSGETNSGFYINKTADAPSLSSTHKGSSSRITLTQQGSHDAHQPRPSTQLHSRAAPELHGSHLQVCGEDNGLRQNTGGL